jgi:hypothetical protein
VKTFAPLDEGLHAMRTLATVRLLRLASWLLRKGLWLYRLGCISPKDLRVVWYSAGQIGQFARLPQRIRTSRSQKRLSNNEARDDHSD